jgi:LacI family kdg operon repressor
LKKPVKLADVAKLVGVSQSTVSNYLNGRTNRISEPIRIRIKEAIEELDYIPNMAARNVSSKTKDNTIAIVVPHSPAHIFYNTFYSRVLEGIGDALANYGYRSIIIPADRKNLDESIAFIRGLSLGMISGLLLFNIEEQDPLLKALKRAHIPVVAFGYGEGYETDLSFIATDHGDGTKQAVRHFVEVHKVRDIILYAGLFGIRITRQRLDGYKEALGEYDIPFDQERVVYAYGDCYDCYSVTKMLLSKRNGPQAYIISQADTNSFIRAVRDSALVPGKDVLFLLDEYFPINSYERYEYAYLKTPVYDLGVQGVERLVKIIRKEPLGTKNFLFPVQLVVNETCGCMQRQ